MLNDAKLLFVLLALYSTSSQYLPKHNTIQELVIQWAPLIWFAPDEQFYPSSVEFFLKHTVLTEPDGSSLYSPINGVYKQQSMKKNTYLMPKKSVLEELQDNSSFLYGRAPKLSPPPLYALLFSCTPNVSFRSSTANNILTDLDILFSGTPPAPHFTVEYWAFYPYNAGKPICFLGKLPTPKLFGHCFGHIKSIGNHVGDWEHMRLRFKGHYHPSEMFLSTHNTGSHYTYDPQHRTFKLKISRIKKFLRKTAAVVRVQSGHPVVFAANGSHGLWPAPGEHEYATRLTDKAGYGQPWKTWENLNIIDVASDEVPKWVLYKGRWGTPKRNCVLSHKLGICEFTEGPAGPLRNHSQLACSAF